METGRRKRMLINLDYDGLAKRKAIEDELGREEILSQLAEECSELAQAANKLRRVLHGTTPVSREEAVSMLTEEIGDVFLMLDCVAGWGLTSIRAAERSAMRKNERWYERTFPNA